MENNNLFENATRFHYLWPFNGQISVEDLWRLSKKELNILFKKLNAMYRTKVGEESLLEEKDDAKVRELEEMIQIVRRIVQVKEAEAKALEEQAALKAEKDKILAVIAAKQEQQLQDLSVDELKKMYEALR